MGIDVLSEQFDSQRGPYFGISAGVVVPPMGVLPGDDYEA
jgi:hypothetical protein